MWLLGQSELAANPLHPTENCVPYAISSSLEVLELLLGVDKRAPDSEAAAEATELLADRVVGGVHVERWIEALTACGADVNKRSKYAARRPLHLAVRGPLGEGTKDTSE